MMKATKDFIAEAHSILTMARLAEAIAELRTRQASDPGGVA